MIKYIKRALSDIKHGNSIEVISALTTGINKHTILDSLYLYPYSKDYYSYILIDKRTKKIISFDCGDYKTSRFNIENLMHENNGSFEALFLTHEHKEHTEGSLDWHRVHPELQIYGGGSFYPFVETVNDGKIIFVGDLCVYCLATPGHTETDISYVVTEVSENSTKTPIVFTGDTLYVGGCGSVMTGSFESLWSSLKKLKSLPNETLVFPGHDNALKNLMVANSLDPDNEFLKRKLTWAKEQHELKANIVGSLIAEERLYNPFFRCDQEILQKLTKTNDPYMCFHRLRSLITKLTL